AAGSSARQSRSAVVRAAAEYRPTAMVKPARSMRFIGNPSGRCRSKPAGRRRTWAAVIGRGPRPGGAGSAARRRTAHGPLIRLNRAVDGAGRVDRVAGARALEGDCGGRRGRVAVDEAVGNELDVTAVDAAAAAPVVAACHLVPDDRGAAEVSGGARPRLVQSRARVPGVIAAQVHGHVLPGAGIVRPVDRQGAPVIVDAAAVFGGGVTRHGALVEVGLGIVAVEDAGAILRGVVGDPTGVAVERAGVH